MCYIGYATDPSTEIESQTSVIGDVAKAEANKRKLNTSFSTLFSHHCSSFLCVCVLFSLFSFLQERKCECDWEERGK